MSGRIQWIFIWLVKKLQKKTNEEYYKSKPLLKLILDVYFIPLNILRFFRYLRMIHEYKKNQVEIQVLSKQLSENDN